MKNFLLFITVFTFSIVNAQNYKNEATIKPIHTDGYYKIILTPEITSHLKDDYSDIRLCNASGKEVPYLLQQESPLKNYEFFKEYEIIENISIPKKNTRLILSNPAQNKITNISLSINNSETTKRARLTGSNDKTNWYIVKENFILESISNSSQTSEIKIVDFPLSDYKFYKIEINDSISEPLKINKAGYYDSYSQYGDYVKLPAFAISQKDSSDKISYIKLNLANQQYIDKIKLFIKGPELYRRNANLCILQKDKHHRPYYSIVQSLEIRSNQENIISINHFKSNDLYLLIENNDNIPVTVIKAEGYQIMNYLIASLNKNESYMLKYGNTALSAPSYDLEYFKNNLPIPVGELIPEDYKNLESLKTGESSTFLQSQAFIWAAIVIVIVLLGYMSNKMIREMKKEEK